MILIGKQALNYYQSRSTHDDYEIIVYSKDRNFKLDGVDYKIHCVMQKNYMTIYNYSYDSTSHSVRTPIGDILVAPKEVLKYFAQLNKDTEALLILKDIPLTPALSKLVDV